MLQGRLLRVVSQAMAAVFGGEPEQDGDPHPDQEGFCKDNRMNKQLKVKAGEWVEIRSKEEILATLDKNGQLEGMPFMPQMFQYCGRRFQVFKRAHKTCDTVYPVRGRRLANGVHLDVRCDGEAYGGCQAGSAFLEGSVDEASRRSGGGTVGASGERGQRNGSWAGRPPVAPSRMFWRVRASRVRRMKRTSRIAARRPSCRGSRRR